MAGVGLSPGQRLPVDPAGDELGRAATRLGSLEHAERDARQLGGGFERRHCLCVRQADQAASVHRQQNVALLQHTNATVSRTAGRNTTAPKPHSLNLVHSLPLVTPDTSAMLLLI